MEEAAAFAGGLPGPVAAAVRGATYQGDLDRDELYDRIARREGAPRGFGMEHAQAVCQVIGEALPEADARCGSSGTCRTGRTSSRRARPERPRRGRRTPASPPEIGQGSTLATGGLAAATP